MRQSIGINNTSQIVEITRFWGMKGGREGFE